CPRSPPTTRRGIAYGRALWCADEWRRARRLLEGSVANRWAANNAAGTAASMLNTAIGAQDWSIAFSAAWPRPPRPYPIDVGIPTTGARTRPATTVGSAPSRPAKTRYVSG